MKHSIFWWSAILLTLLNAACSAEQPGAGTFHTWTPEACGLETVPLSVPGQARDELAESLSFFAEDSYGGVCIGDVDGDERPDLLFSAPYGGHRFYRNLGGFRFEDATDAVGLSAVSNIWVRGATFADLDGDGTLDLYLAGNGEAGRVLMNRDGRFELATDTGLEHDAPSVMMQFADYDLDGDLDGYLAIGDRGKSAFTGEFFKLDVEFRDGKPVIPPEHSELYDVLMHPTLGPKVIPVGNHDRLFRNEGNGIFTDVTTAAGISGPGFGLAASWFDADDDGDPDLYVANDFYTPDKFYRNNGDGTFTDIIATAMPHTPWFSMGTAVGDINNDGRLDLLATDMSGSTHYKSKLGMGDMEKSLWFLELPTPRQYMRNALYINTGTDRYLEAAQLAGIANTDWTWSPKFADFDQDGRLDLFIANGMTRDLTNSDLVQRGEALPPEERRKFWEAQDRKRDRNMAFRNAGDLQFEPKGAAWGLDAPLVSFGAATADLDGDGDLDLVTTNLDPPFLIHENRVASGNAVTLSLRGTKSNTHGFGARITAEAGGAKFVRELQPVQGYISSDQPIVHIGIGSAAIVDRLTVRWPSGTVQTLTRLETGRRHTITEPQDNGPVFGPELTPEPWFQPSDHLAGFRHVENTFDDFAAQPLLPNRLSQFGPGMAWSDVDNDGDMDAFLCGAKDQPSRLLLWDADAEKFAAVKNPMIDFFVEQEDMAALFFEFNGDGLPDLYVIAGGGEYKPGTPYLQDRLYVNQGAGQFAMAKRETPRIMDSGGALAAADFDRDGDLDWFVGARLVPGAYPTTPKSHLVRNEAGKATKVVTDDVAPGLATVGMVTSALWSDVDADGWPDLVLATEWGAVRLWKNEGGRLVDRTRMSGLATITGWWNSVASGDFNGDGFIDFVAGNVGLNSKYHASAVHPVVAHYGDMDGSGNMRFVESCYEDNEWFPVRGRSCSTRAMPSLSERFPNFDSFAKATVLEIFPLQRRNKALRLDVNTLASGVFLNDGKGAFRFAPLPREAQVAPTFGIRVALVDGDAIPDLVLVQNFYGPQAETGRLDGGIGNVLRGRGDGTFEVVPPTVSGFVVPGDAKALAAPDLNRDGRPDLVVTENNGPVRSFLRTAESAPRLQPIRFAGTAKNPYAVGAQLRLLFTDGRHWIGESQAGSGYLSQSPGILSVPQGELQSITVRWPDGLEESHTALPSDGVLRRK